MVEVVLATFSVTFWFFFSKFSLIPSNIMAPPSIIVEISADGWKARFLLWKTVKTSLKLLYKRWHYTLLNVRASFLDIQRDKHTNIQTNKKQHCILSPVAVHPPISTEFFMCIEDVRPIFAPLTFSDLTHSFCTQDPGKFWWKLPVCGFLPITPSVRHRMTSNLKHFRRPHQRIKLVYFINIDWRIHPYGANKFEKFRIF